MAHRPAHLVDFHTHAFPEKVADRAVQALAAAYQVHPVAPPTPAGLLGVMDEAGVDVSVILPVATRPDQVRSINDWAAEVNSDRLVCFGAMHPDVADPAAEVDRMVSLGLKGLKLQPQFQEFYPDEERLFPLYQALQGKLIAVFHTGQEIVNVPHVYARPAALARVRERFPHLVIVAAHMGGFRLRDEAKDYVVGKAQYLETSYCTDLTDQELAATIRLHGVDRVLFGTDFPWSHARADLERLCRLGLTQAETEAVAWRNASRLLGLRLG